MEARYSSLGLGNALHRSCDYAGACKELAALVKEVYSVAPKSIQAILFQDVILAFRILQERRWCSSGDVSSATVLLQASEAVLPKQKKGIVATEYKRAAISLQRSSKHHSGDEEDCCQIPVDVLVHVFSFLDPISLATAARVCRTWYAGSKDDQLWHKNFLRIVGDASIDPRILLQAGFQLSGPLPEPCRVKDIRMQTEGSWRKAFELAILRLPKSIYLLTRAQCLSCKRTFWSSELCSIDFENTCKKKSQEHRLRPLLSEQVVSYVLVGSRHLLTAVNESDSDEEDHLPYAKLWEYAKCLR